MTSIHIGIFFFYLFHLGLNIFILREDVMVSSNIHFNFFFFVINSKIQLSTIFLAEYCHEIPAQL